MKGYLVVVSGASLLVSLWMHQRAHEDARKYFPLQFADEFRIAILHAVRAVQPGDTLGDPAAVRGCLGAMAGGRRAASPRWPISPAILSSLCSCF